MIPEEIINQILDRCDIAEVISAYVPLKKAGRNFKANCPFHTEKTPSFLVSPDKGIYHCFGCGAGGNALSFLMKHENMEFTEAMALLARKAGVELPKYEPRGREPDSLANILEKAHEAAAAYFQENLRLSAGKRPSRYLEERGIKPETAAQFRLGYAADSWDGLLTAMKKRGFTEQLLEKAGLVLPRDDKSGYYDRFRDRVIFPICDARGRVVAFAGRVLDEHLPKYVNSPETPLYSKSRILYGLHLSKNSIRKLNYTVIVEGYLDMMIPYQAGVTNVIATCGTALTVDHIRLLKRHSGNVIMVYDPDTAGEMATLRSLDILVAEDMQVRVASMPRGDDPDTFVRKNGAQAFWDLLKGSKGLYEYKLELLKRRHDTGVMEVKVKVAQEMMQTIGLVSNAVLQSAYIKRLAEELGLNEEALRIELKRSKGAKRESADPADADIRLDAQTRQMRQVDKILISLMLDDNAVIPFVREHVEMEDFPEGLPRTVMQRLFASAEQKRVVTPAQLIQSLSDDGNAPSLLSEIAALQDTLEDKHKNLEDCLAWLKEKRVKKRLEELRGEIKAAQLRNEEEKVIDLMARYNELVKRCV